MSVSDGFRDFVVEQLEQCARDIRAKRMFGAVGIYSGEYFFAVIDDDRLYFKVDDQTRPTFEAEGMEPARITASDGEVMTLGYYEVPLGVLEAPEDLRKWVRDAVAVAQRAAAAKRPRRKSPITRRKSTTNH
jgi:DNA transformation protein and related proteins